MCLDFSHAEEVSLPTYAQVTVVKSLIMSRLDYTNVLYLGLPEFLIQQLQVVQNMAVYLLYKIQNYTLVSEFRERLHWLPVWKCIVYKALTLTHQALYSKGRVYLNERSKQYSPGRPMCSSNASLIVVPA